MGGEGGGSGRLRRFTTRMAPLQPEPLLCNEEHGFLVVERPLCKPHVSLVILIMLLLVSDTRPRGSICSTIMALGTQKPF